MCAAWGTESGILCMHGVSGRSCGDGPQADATVAGAAGGDVTQLHQHAVSLAAVCNIVWRTVADLTQQQTARVQTEKCGITTKIS